MSTSDFLRCFEVKAHHSPQYTVNLNSDLVSLLCKFLLRIVGYVGLGFCSLFLDCCF